MLGTLLFSLALAFDEPTKIDMEESYGRTPEQIVGMGWEKWYDFYIGKTGSETTMSMNFASMLYGDSLYIINSGLLRKVDSGRRQVISALRRPMFDYKQACVQVGYTRTGGGTMWSLFSSGVRMSAEEVIGKLIDRKPDGRSATQSEVRAVWDEIQLKVESEHAMISQSSSMTGVSYDELLQTVRSGRRMFENDVKLIGRIESAKERAMIFGYYLDGAETARSTEME
ncbi:hypothetical protein CCB80_05345 [Armatimonadetes bacterium Uphvl-Ar1]|nr:hypothetical protein CCB80_05345 [Armatimonadetes bacterium Uphvl-Ar1]